MATAQEAVRRLTIQTSAPGADEAAASLRKVEKAMDGVTVASQSTEKATLSLDNKFAAIERKYVAQVRAQQDYEKIQRQVNAAVAQNPALQERANVVLAQAAARLNATGVANDNVTKSTGLARHELINLGRQAQDVAVSLAGGQSPFTVLAQQGSQIADVFVSSEAGLKGFAMQAREGLASLLTPGRAVVLGFAAAGAAAYGLYRLLRTEEPTAEKNLEEHARLVGIVKSAYGDATDAAGKFYAQSREQTILQSIANIDRLKNNLRSLVEEMTKASTTPTSLGMPEMGIAPDPSAVVAQDRFKGLGSAISDLQDSIRAGAPDFEAFNKRVSELGTNEPALREAALRLLEISKSATEMSQKVALAEASLRLMQGTATEADRALLNLSGTINKVDMGKIREQNELAMKSLTAFSPAAKAEIAFQETRLRLQDQVNRQQLTAAEQLEQAEAARALSLKGSQVAISEAARERELAARQAVAQSELEISLIGRTIGEQTRLRADLQARQQIEQEAARNRTAFDEAEFARLQKINAELGQRAEMVARAQVKADISFGRQTSLLSPEDVAIAQQLKNLYPDVATALASVEAQGLRTNQALSGLASTASGALTTGLTDILDGTKSVGQGFQDMSKIIIRAIQEMIVKLLIVQPLMQSLQGTLGGSTAGGGIGGLGFLGSLFGGAPSVTASGAIAGAIGPTSVGGAPLVGLHSGGIVGSEATFTRYVHPAYFDDAPRMHTGGIAGDEVPIIAKKGEGVFTPGQMRALGGGAVTIGDTNIVIRGNVGPNELEAIKAELAAHRRVIAKQVDDQRRSTRLNMTGVG